MILCACSPNWHLKQAEKHIRKAQIKGAEIKTDTLWLKDTVFIKAIRVDSIFTALKGDTVVLTKDRLKIVYIKLGADSVFIEGECEADTVIHEVPVTIVKEIKSGMAWWWLAVVFIGTSILFFFARK